MTIHQLHPKRLAQVVLGSAVLTLVLALLLQPQHVNGQNNSELKWSVDAMACVPNGSTSRNELMDTSHGHARYAEGKTGDAYLICPFTATALQGMVVRGIAMTFRDNTPNGSITASLRMMDKRSGAVLDALRITSDCLIDSTQLGNPYWTCSNIGTGHQLDFNRYYYYVQFSLRRSTTTADVRMVGAGIW
jgi:hypothetical protein